MRPEQLLGYAYDTPHGSLTVDFADGVKRWGLKYEPGNQRLSTLFTDMDSAQREADSKNRDFRRLLLNQFVKIQDDREAWVNPWVVVEVMVFTHELGSVPR